MRILKNQLRRLPFLANVRGTDTGIAGRFRRIAQPTHEDVYAAAEKHGFNAVIPRRANYFEITLQENKDAPFVVLLNKTKGRVHQAWIITPEQNLNPAHRAKILAFFKEVAHNPN